jgi:hypothetical protein
VPVPRLDRLERTLIGNRGPTVPGILERDSLQNNHRRGLELPRQDNPFRRGQLTFVFDAPRETPGATIDTGAFPLGTKTAAVLRREPHRLWRWSPGRTVYTGLRWAERSRTA